MYKDVLILLAEKHRFFLQIEQISEPLQSAEADALVAGVEARQQCFAQIAVIDKAVESSVAGDVQVRKALNQDCNRDQLTAAQKELYDASFKIKAVVNRIIKNDSTIFARIAVQKEEIQQKLVDIGNSGSAVAGQYYDSLRTRDTQQVGREIRKKI